MEGGGKKGRRAWKSSPSPFNDKPFLFCTSHNSSLFRARLCDYPLSPLLLPPTPSPLFCLFARLFGQHLPLPPQPPKKGKHAAADTPVPTAGNQAGAPSGRPPHNTTQPSPPHPPSHSEHRPRSKGEAYHTQNPHPISNGSQQRAGARQPTRVAPPPAVPLALVAEGPPCTHRPPDSTCVRRGAHTLPLPAFAANKTSPLPFPPHQKNTRGPGLCVLFCNRAGQPELRGVKSNREHRRPY